jgi:GDP-L-fucose synthase
MNKNAKIYIAGHTGLVGSAIWRNLESRGFENLIGFSRKDYDLRDSIETLDLFHNHKPDYVFLCAALVGGIGYNAAYPADFIYSNLAIQTNVIEASRVFKVEKLVFLGSSCIYPKYSKQPIEESELLTGPLEPTNEAYAIAKIAGIKMCQAYNSQYGTNYVSVMPTNLYGPNDRYDIKRAHSLPTLIKKFHDAKITGQKEVILWGDGTPRREFLHSDDFASAAVLVMEEYDSSEPINVGYGSDVSIAELAEIISKEVGWNGKIIWDDSKPNGTPRKLLSSYKINKLGWKPKISLEEGIRLTYRSFYENCRVK